MAKSDEFIGLLTAVKKDIITAIGTEIGINSDKIISVVGNAEMSLTSETYGLSNEVHLKTINIGENVVTVTHLNDEVSEVAFGDLSMDDLLTCLQVVEGNNYTLD